MSENKENLNKLDSIVEMADERDPLPSADEALLALGQKGNITCLTLTICISSVKSLWTRLCMLL